MCVGKGGLHPIVKGATFVIFVGNSVEHGNEKPWFINIGLEYSSATMGSKIFLQPCLTQGGVCVCFAQRRSKKGSRMVPEPS